MAFTAEQEAAVLALLDAVGQSGLTNDQLVKVLKIGKVTTDIAEMQAQVEVKVAEKDAFNQSKDAEINTVKSQIVNAQQQLRELQTI